MEQEEKVVVEMKGKDIKKLVKLVKIIERDEMELGILKMK